MSNIDLPESKFSPFSAQISLCSSNFRWKRVSGTSFLPINNIPKFWNLVDQKSKIYQIKSKKSVNDK